MLVLRPHADHGLHRAIGEQDAAGLVEQHQWIGKMGEHLARERTEQAGRAGAKIGPLFQKIKAAFARQERRDGRRDRQSAHHRPERGQAKPARQNDSEREPGQTRPEDTREVTPICLRAVHAALAKPTS